MLDEMQSGRSWCPGWFRRWRRFTLIFLFALARCRLLANLSAARAVCDQLSVLIHDHNCLWACGDVCIGAFLDPWRSAQLDIAGGSNISRLIRPANRAGGRASVWVRSIPDDRDVSLRDGFFQSLIFTFRDVNGQFFGLQSKARIGHFHVTAKNADVLVGIKEGVIRINLCCDGTIRWRALDPAEQRIRLVSRRFRRFLLFLRGGSWRWAGRSRRLSRQRNGRHAKDNENNCAESAHSF